MARGVHSLLREAIRGILREEASPDLRGKTLARVQPSQTELGGQEEKSSGHDLNSLPGINDALAKNGINIEVGVLVSADADSSTQKISFAFRPKYNLENIKLLDSVNNMSVEKHFGQFYSEKKLSGVRNILRAIPQGSINFFPADEISGNCGGAWIIERTWPTTTGWGPLLYDLALEWTSSKGGGLTSDRNIVSPSAREVWKKYFMSRSDVDSTQLDVDYIASTKEGEEPDLERWGPQITPGDSSDDCDQREAQETAEKNAGVESGKSNATGLWQTSPLSRSYTKTDGTVTGALKAAHLYWEK